MLEDIKNILKGWSPPSTGFSPARSPGLVVSVPVLLFFSWLGWTLCGWNPYLMPLIILYVSSGIILGPPISIAAHYNLFITLAALAILVSFPKLLEWTNTLHNTKTTSFTLISYVINGLLSILLLAQFVLYIKNKD